MTSELVWYLTSCDGSRHRLPREMLFVGRQDCELLLKCQTVEEQHAVLNYDSVQDAFRIKDLGSANGTFVNDTRLPEQVYITMKDGDTVRFGFDQQIYTIAKLIRVMSVDNGSLLGRRGGKLSTSVSSSSSSSNSSSSSSSSRKSSTSTLSSTKHKLNPSRISASKPPDAAGSNDPDRIPTKEPANSGGGGSSPASFVVDVSENPRVVAKEVKTLQHYVSLRDAKRKAALKEKKEVSNSVDRWFAVNQPPDSGEGINDNPDKEENESEKKKTVNGSSNMLNGLSRPLSSGTPTKSSGRSASSKHESQRSSGNILGLTSSSRPASSVHRKEVLLQASKRLSTQTSSSLKGGDSKKESSSSSSSSSGSSKRSEAGTYTVRNEANSQAVEAGELAQLGGAAADPSQLRSSWVNEWVNQHQIPLRPFEENEDKMSRSGSDGQRVRRSLPVIPVQQLGTRAAEQECGDETAAKSDVDGKPKKSQDRPRQRESSLKGSCCLSVASGGGAKKRRSSSNDPAALSKVDFALNVSAQDDGLKEEGGNARPAKTRSSVSGISHLDKSQDKHFASSHDISPEQSRLLRSDSFTKDCPSGVVPEHEIPDASLVRSSSFTKLHPGLPSDMIPRITSESSEYSLDVDASLDTSLLMKDTDEVMDALKRRPRRQADDLSAVSLTDGQTDDRKTRDSPRRVLRDQQRRVASSSSPQISRKTPTVSKSKRSPLRLKQVSTQLSSDTECSRESRRPLHRTNSCTEVESSSSLRLTRTTLLRQSRAKEVNSSRPKQTSSTTTVATQPSSNTNKKLSRVTMERLNELSKPPARRLSRNSDNESDTEIGRKPSRKTTGYQSFRRSRDTTTTTESDVSPTQRSGTSLGGRIVRESRKDNNRSKRFDASTAKRSWPGYHTASSDAASTQSTSDSEFEDAIDDRLTMPNTSNRSPPDGEMSSEIARVSHLLARDMRLLTSRTLEDTTTSSGDFANMSSSVSPSEHDSLEPTIQVDSPPAPARRRTWNHGRSALDSLMLSNVCALSTRLSAVADTVVGKIAVMRGGAPNVDISKSQVPLLQQTASQEMAVIVNNLRRVEMQLLRADEIIDPDRKLQDLIHD